MPTFEKSFEIASAPEAVWSVVADSEMAPRIFPDVVSNTADPPGVAHVGQKVTAVIKMGGRKVPQIAEMAEVIPNRKMVLRGFP